MPEVAPSITTDERINFLLDNVPAMMHSIDAEGNLIAVSNEWLRVLGYTRSDVIGRKSISFLTEASRRRAATHIKNLFNGGTVHDARFDFVARDGAIVPMLLSAMAETDPETGVFRAMAVLRPAGDVDEAKAQLETREHHLQHVLNSLPVILLATDAEGVITVFEGTGLKAMELQAEDFLGHSALGNYMLSDEPDGSPTATEVHVGISAALKGQSHTNIVRFANRLIEVRYGPVFGAHGVVDGALAIGVDVTEQQQTMEELRESEARYRLVVNQATDVVWATDPEGRLTFISPAIEHQSGFTPDDLMGVSVYDVFPPEAVEKMQNLLAESETSGTPNARFELPAYRKDGSDAWIEVDAGAIRDDDGTLIGMHGITREITERKAAEEALRDSEERYRVLAEQFKDTVWATDAMGKLTYISPNIEDNSGFTQEEAMRGTFQDLFPPESLPQLSQLAAKVMSGECDSARFETQGLNKDGTSGWIEIDFVVLRDEDGRVKATQGIIRDIAERKAAEAALLESESRYRLLAEYATDVIWSTDAAANIVYMSPSVVQQSGFTPEETIGAPFTTFFPDESIAKLGELIAEGMAGTRDHARIEVLALRKDGGTFWAEINAAMIRDDDGNPVSIQGITRDITERKAAEAALYESEAQLRTIFDQASVGITIVDVEGNYLQANDRYCEMLGYTREEIASLSALDIIHPDDQSEELAHLVKLTTREADVVQRETRRVHKDGSIVWCRCSQTLMRNADDEPTVFLNLLEDITERRGLEEQLLQAQKMEAVGTLAGGIAHDFNNLLTGILGSVEMAKLDLGSDAAAGRHLERVGTAAERAADLTRQLLTVSRRQEPNFGPTDVNALVVQTADLLRRTIPESIAIVTNLEESLGTIRGDAVQLEQALLNIAINARDAMPNGGTLSFDVSIEQTRDVSDDLSKTGVHMLRTTASLDGNAHMHDQYVRITISDTGEGMDQEVVDRIFDPFYTTKEQGKGTGLGLAMVYGCVIAHDGAISVDSQPGLGTSMSISLPLLDTSTVEAPKELSSSEATGSETILLVDDADAVIEVGEVMLQTLGYRVLIARDGRHALEAYEEHRDEIAIIVTDMVMPIAGGEELLCSLRKAGHDIDVIAISGYAPGTSAQGLLDVGFAAFVPKPFRMEDLAKTVRSVLDGGRSVRHS